MRVDLSDATLKRRNQSGSMKYFQWRFQACFSERSLVMIAACLAQFLYWSPNSASVFSKTKTTWHGMEFNHYCVPICWQSFSYWLKSTVVSIYEKEEAFLCKLSQRGINKHSLLRCFVFMLKSATGHWHASRFLKKKRETQALPHRKWETRLIKT